MADPNRWQPLALEMIVTQNGIPVPDKVQTYIGARWNRVTPFALTRGNPDDVYLDPGPPPCSDMPATRNSRSSSSACSSCRAQLTPDDGVMHRHLARRLRQQPARHATTAPVIR